MLTLCTRFLREDYLFKGTDKEAYRNFLKKCTQHNVNKLFSPSRVTILLWDETLFVTGIPTTRKDFIGTVIRYSFLFSVNKERFWWFNSLKSYLERGGTELGTALDNLLSIDNEANDFTLPKEADFIKTVEAVLESFARDSCSPALSCRLYSELCPVERNTEKVKEYLATLSGLPHSFGFEFKDLKLITEKDIERARPFLQKISMLLGLLCLLLGLLFFLLPNESSQTEDESNKSFSSSNKKLKTAPKTSLEESPTTAIEIPKPLEQSSPEAE